MNHKRLYPEVWGKKGQLEEELDRAEPYYTYAYETGRRPQIYEVFDMLRRGKWIILITSVVVLALVTIYVLTVPAEYESRSLLYVNMKPADVQGALSAGMGEAPASSENGMTDEVMILQESLPIAERVAERLLAMQVAPDTREPLTILQTDDAEITVREVVDRLQTQYVNVGAAGEESNAIWISATSTVPAEAALITNLYTEEYVARSREVSRARISSSVNFLQEQKTKLEQELTELEDRIATYMSRQNAVALDTETDQVVTQIGQLESELDAVRVEKEMKTALVSSLEQEIEKINPRLAQRVASGVEKEIESAQTKIAEYEMKLEEIYLRNPELRENPQASPDVQRLLEGINLLRQRVSQLSQQYVDEAMDVGGIDPTQDGSGLEYLGHLKRQIIEERVALSGFEARERTIEQRLREHRAKLRAIPERSIQLSQMQRAQASAEQTYLTVTEKLQEARLAEESEPGYVDIIRQAIIPTEPVRPKKKRSMAFGALLGLALGVVLAVVRQSLSNRVYQPEDLRKHGHSVTGVIPDMTRSKELYGKTVVNHNDKEMSTALVTLYNPLSSVAEAYRRLRTNIQFGLPDGTIQTLVVTSPEPGAGKSTTAINLAVTMAEAGRRTLLVDTDLRQPTIHSKMDLQDQPTLTSLSSLSEAADIERFATDVTDLYVLTAGTDVPNPAKLLSSKRLQDMINVWREQFDIIIFDTPPMMVAADAALLSTQSDATLMVVRAGKTSTDALRESTEALAGVGAVIVGTVINYFDPRVAHGYRYDYNYGANNRKSLYLPGDA